MNSHKSEIKSENTFNLIYLDPPDLQAGRAASIGESRMHNASAGLFAVLTGGLDLAGLDGERGTGVEGAG